ncbi:MAG TPA: isochorismatase family protein [Variovorax sp.]
MPFATLDPVTALVVIDLQKGIVGLPTAHPAADIVDRASQLARAFREHGRPVVLVNVAGVAPGRTDAPGRSGALPPDWSQLVPELDAQASDQRVTKMQWGAFLGTSLDQYLRRRGVTQIVLVGISTSIGVESTARAAYELGYNVVLAIDAMTDLDADAHRNSVTKIFPRLGEVTTTSAVLAALR